jgi:hypothetical protein
MSYLSRIWACSVSNGIPRRSLVIALVLGTLLTFVNQGDALTAGRNVDLMEIVLTYAILYGVAMYGAVSYRRGKTR